MTAKAMIDSLLFTDREGWTFLRMKWAKTHMIAPGLFERDIIGDDLNNGSSAANFGDFVLSDH
jgi:hypothetical protein